MESSAVAMAIAVIVVAVLKFTRGSPVLYGNVAPELSDLAGHNSPRDAIAVFLLAVPLFIGVVRFDALLLSSF